METYLTIMVTVLVATQVIRITQNAIQLHRLKNRIGTATDDEVLAMWDKLVESINRLSEKIDK
jgi:uncharacterized protein YqeY